MAELRWGVATDPGRHRTDNEDHAFAGDGLFVVADGMGGHQAGEVASEMAVNRLNERLPSETTSTLDDLVGAIGAANEEIYEASVSHADQAGMGTTVTAIAVVSDPHDGEVLAVANVGDSRGYMVRHGRLRQITHDHSFVQELVAEGAISSDEARTHPRRNIVTRALGIESSVRVDSWTMPIVRGDRFVLCSDGLVDEVPDDRILELLNEHPDDPTVAAQALVDAANEAGGRDNITVVVVDVLEGDDPPDPTAEFDVVPLWKDDVDRGDDTAEHDIVTDPSDDTAGEWPSPDGDAVPTLPPPGLYDGGEDLPPGDAPAVSRSRRLVRFAVAVGVAAVLVLGFALLSAWARSGYFVAFDDDDKVVIYQGRRDGFLWFEPTREATGQYTRDQLDDSSIALIEDAPSFETRASAERFVSERITPTTTTTSTTTTSTTSTTAPSTTTLPDATSTVP